DGFAPQWIGEHDPNNNNGWIEWDVPLRGEVDEPMVDPEVNEEVMDDDDWDDEVHLLPQLRDRLFLPVPPTVIEDLSTRLGNLEHRHGVLMMKIEEVSDAEVADSITIGEIHPRVAIVGEQMEEVSDAEVADSIAIGEIHPRVAIVGEQVESRVNNHPSGQMAVQGQDVIAGSSQQVQTLKTALHEIELQNQQLWTRVTEMESHMGILMSYIMWMEDRLTVLEKRLPGPPPGPQ
nr:hypothetical protein [Tanacetum cinerariifolium]